MNPKEHRASIEKYIDKKRAVIIGLSGGGDSVYLFHELIAQRKRTGFYMLAVHVHHGLRGEEADRDEKFSKGLCAENGVDFVVEHVDVRKYAEEHGLTLEQAGREVRYAAFTREAKRLLSESADLVGVDIFLAHHANDQEETVLMNFLRGSGPAGLSGMKECTAFGDEQHIRLVRPLLSLTHQEMLDSLTDRGLSWCEDATNAESDFTRNKLRCDILPRLKEISPGFTEVCGREARLFDEIEDFLDGEVQKAFSAYAREEDGVVLFPVEELLGLHPALRHVLVRKCIDHLSGLKDISTDHVDAVESLLSAQSGKYVELPRGIRVGREFDQICFSRADAIRNEQTFKFNWEIVPFDEGVYDKILGKFCSESYTKWMDYDKIEKYCGEGAPQLRHPRENDYLLINRQGQKKRLALYLKQEKIPQRKRERINVVAYNDVILWVPGLRDSAYFFVTEDTRRVLRLHVDEA